jgi:hypothetical protein
MPLNMPQHADASPQVQQRIVARWSNDDCVTMLSQLHASSPMIPDSIPGKVLQYMHSKRSRMFFLWCVLDARNYGVQGSSTSRMVRALLLPPACTGALAGSGVAPAAGAPPRVALRVRPARPNTRATSLRPRRAGAMPPPLLRQVATSQYTYGICKTTAPCLRGKTFVECFSRAFPRP